MTVTARSGVEPLRDVMAGTVGAPGDADYDEALRVWNSAIDARPALIARCRSAADNIFHRNTNIEPAQPRSEQHTNTRR